MSAINVCQVLLICTSSRRATRSQGKEVTFSKKLAKTRNRRTKDINDVSDVDGNTLTDYDIKN